MEFVIPLNLNFFTIWSKDLYPTYPSIFSYALTSTNFWANNILAYARSLGTDYSFSLLV